MTFLLNHVILATKMPLIVNLPLFFILRTFYPSSFESPWQLTLVSCRVTLALKSMNIFQEFMADLQSTLCISIYQTDSLSHYNCWSVDKPPHGIPAKKKNRTRRIHIEISVILTRSSG